MRGNSLLPIVLPALLLALLTGSAAAQEQVRGAKIHNAPNSSTEYRRKFAIIIGVNDYSPEEQAPGEKKGKGLPSLKNAENDAQALHDVLIKYYGYQQEDVHLFLGSSPDENRNAKEATLVKALANISQNLWSDPNHPEDPPTEITAEDSVLFFFSGHGMLKTGANSQTFYIMPSNVSMQGDVPLDHTVLKGNDLVEGLSNCKARHKLIILDCCHAGGLYGSVSVFSGVQNSRPAAEFRSHSSASFNSEGFQAMVASHQMEQASDGNWQSANSPFSQALILSLKTIPSYWHKSPFSVRQLFSLMQSYFLAKQRQSPDLRWLNEGSGDFHFIPDAAANFESQENVDRGLRNLLISMFPGVNGNWWFEETPWMMPAIRLDILAHMDQPRSPGVNNLRIGELRDAAERFRAKLDREKGTLGKLELLRLHHIQLLLSSRDLNLSETLTAIQDELAAYEASTATKQSVVAPPGDKGAAPDPCNNCDQLQAVDLHFKAVVAHRLLTGNDPAEEDRVEEYYKDALTLYKNELFASGNLTADPPPSGTAKTEANATSGGEATGPLPINGLRVQYSLCFSDYAHFLANRATPNYRESLKNAIEAEEVLWGTALPPSEIFLKSLQANALFNLGMWGASNERLNEMASQAREMAKDQKKSGGLPHPLVAWTLKEQAWKLMDQWRVTEAKYLFMEAREFNNAAIQVGSVASTDPDLNASRDRTLDGAAANQIDFDEVVAYLHSSHGLAIVQRYSGYSQAAADTYADLIEDVRIRKQEHLLSTRRNSESSYSFAEIQNRLHDRLVNSLERRGDCGLFGNPQNLMQADDDYRLAMREWSQLSKRDLDRKVSFSDRRALVLALPSSVQDLELSRALLTMGDEWSLPENHIGELRTRIIEQEEPKENRIHGLIADFVLRTLETRDEERVKVLAEWRTLIDVQSRKGLVARNIPRDQLEALLLGMRLLIQFDLEQPTTDRAKTYSDVELLTNLCRLINRDKQVAIDNRTIAHASFLEPATSFVGVNSDPPGEGELSLRDTGTATDDEYELTDIESTVGLRRFLRPYYDIAVEALVKLEGKHVRPELEIIDEALIGPQVAFHSHGPRLYYFNTSNYSYLFMDVPGELSNVYVVSNSSNLARVQRASRREVALLAFPSTFTADWKRLSEEAREAIKRNLKDPDSEFVCWRDDVHSIGVSWHPNTRVGFIPESQDQSNPGMPRFTLQKDGAFPFDLSEIGIDVDEKAPAKSAATGTSPPNRPAKSGGDS